MTAQGDAWGAALLDQWAGLDVADLLLDVRGGTTTTAMHPAWFFRGFDEWDPWERDLLGAVGVGDGPVLDLGCGAGRAALHFQSMGLPVTAVDSSPGAVEVCRRRGVTDARLGNFVASPPAGHWGAVLLLCGNLGLGGTFEGNRSLLRSLAAVCRPGAVLVGDSVRGDHADGLELRIRYRDLVGDWWAQRNVDSSEVPALVEGTGWTIERHVVDDAGVDHAVLLRRAAQP